MNNKNLKKSYTHLYSPQEQDIISARMLDYFVKEGIYGRNSQSSTAF